MINKEELISYLSENKALLQRDLGIESIGIFGSVARGEQTNLSDIDIVVQLYPQTVDIFEKKESLRSLLNNKFSVNVDILNKKFIKPYAKDYILKDAIYAY